MDLFLIYSLYVNHVSIWIVLSEILYKGNHF
jgi:hypothetical protein